MYKKTFLFLLTILLMLVIWQHELIWYGLKQGRGQLEIVRNAVDLEVVLQSTDFPDSLKDKIQLIQKAKKYAIEVLDFKQTDNYTTLYDQEGEITLWSISACKPYSFEPKTWWFPIVGYVSYKGYFNKQKALETESQLQSEGWDVRLRPVSGWSTLGWFKDPILSSMLNRSEGQLAELIVHELTHSAIFVKDRVTFNENLASFVGEQGARQFLKMNYGADSREMQEYLATEEDSKKFTHHMLISTRKLDSLFQSFTDDLDGEVKERKKKTLIAEICARLDTINFSNPRYKFLFLKKKPNNAYFMSFLRYHSTGDSLKNVWKNQYNSDLKLFVKDCIDKYGS